MSDTREHLRALDRMEVPDVWRHVIELEPGPEPTPPPPVSPIRRLAVAALALVVFAAADSLAWIALRPGSSAETAGHISPSPSEDLASRPLALPSLAPGEACPTTPTTTISPGQGTGFFGSFIAQRAGHVYLVNGPAVKLRRNSRQPDGRYGIKDIWVIDGSYSGPVLIRGGRLDGAGTIELAWNPETPRMDALRIDSGSPSLQADATTGWRSVPMGAFVRTPGCYGYQIDGLDFTTFIVFQATR